VNATVLVMAKAPVPGLVKTRLAATEGHERAADLARSALLDTLRTSAEVFSAGRRVLALSGRLADAAGASEVESSLDGWTVLEQRGADFATRLANAHADAHAHGGPVVQIGMDTPHLTAHHLVAAASRAMATGRPVLGPAEDGGWWVLVSTDPADVHGLEDVPMSTTGTYEATRALLAGNAGEVLSTHSLRDVDDATDADAAAQAAPASRFAATWIARTGRATSGRAS
jgi:glycosyltransferase A (GT-A) superfamily protein (DUF2064 family)